MLGGLRRDASARIVLGSGASVLDTYREVSISGNHEVVGGGWPSDVYRRLMEGFRAHGNEEHSTISQNDLSLMSSSRPLSFATLGQMISMPVPTRM